MQRGNTLASLTHSYSYIAIEDVQIFQEAVKNKGSGEAILNDDNSKEYKSYQVTTHYFGRFIAQISRFELSQLIRGVGYDSPMLC